MNSGTYTSEYQDARHNTEIQNCLEPFKNNVMGKQQFFIRTIRII